MRIVTPAWWCEPCRAWWPGSWVVGWEHEPSADDVEAARPYLVRTCPECGEPLVPRGRPIGGTT